MNRSDYSQRCKPWARSLSSLGTFLFRPQLRPNLHRPGLGTACSGTGWVRRSRDTTSLLLLPKVLAVVADVGYDGAVALVVVLFLEAGRLGYIG
jgi:hypothetical protein